MSDPTILVGAVAYDPKAVTIWEGIREHFADQRVAMDCVLVSNYEPPVEPLLPGHVDVAWNTPLAHVRVRRRTQNHADLRPLHVRRRPGRPPGEARPLPERALLHEVGEPQAPPRAGARGAQAVDAAPGRGVREPSRGAGPGRKEVT